MVIYQHLYPNLSVAAFSIICQQQQQVGWQIPVQAISIIYHYSIFSVPSSFDCRAPFSLFKGLTRLLLLGFDRQLLSRVANLAITTSPC